MKSKKILALLLVLVMTFAFAAACADDAVTVDPEAPPTPPPAATPTPAPEGEDEDEPEETTGGPPGGTLTTIVNLVDSNILGGWSNAVGNAQMRDLTGNYASPVAYTRGAEFIVNDIVASVQGPVANADGTRTWTITINEGLMFSDGTPIKAENYVFAYLFWGAPAMSFAGSDADNPMPNLGNSGWQGYREVMGFLPYRTGEADEITGVRLLGEYTYSVTIDEYTAGNPNFPFFFEITYIDQSPAAMHVIAPGLSVEDTGTGVRVSGDGLTYDLLRTTVDDGVDGGIRYTGGPSAGPYYNAAPVDLDGGVIVVQRNPYFHGAYDGTKPHIDTIILRSVAQDVAIPTLQQGEADLLVGQSGPSIPPGLELVEGGGFDYLAFPRSGSGGLFFHQDIGPTQFVEVRRAIAWTLDRHEFNNLWAAGHATTNDTLMSVASWMFIENRDRVPDYITYNYTLNLANAVAELDAGGWTLKADGTEWTGPDDGPRHKDVDGELMPLVIRWGSPIQNPIGEILSSLMTEPAYSVGIHFEQDFFPANTDDFSWALLGLDENWAPMIGVDGPTRRHMINGGLGIPTIIEMVWNSYNPDPDFWGSQNWTRTADEELYQFALGRKNAASREEYLENWFGFIGRFNVVLPVLPLNADTFHDFFTDRLENYERTDLFSWSRAIIWANLAEYPR